MLFTKNTSRTRFSLLWTFGLALFCAGLFVFASAALAADPFGLGSTYNAIGSQKTALISSPTELIANIVKTALALIGTIFFLLMLYAGFLWMTSRGSQEQAKKAKEMIVAAVIGVVIVSGAYAMTSFVLSGLSVGTIPGATKDGGSGEGSGQACVIDQSCPDGETCQDHDDEGNGTCKPAVAEGPSICICRAGNTCTEETQEADCHDGICSNGQCTCPSAGTCDTDPYINATTCDEVQYRDCSDSSQCLGGICKTYIAGDNESKRCECDVSAEEDCESLGIEMLPGQCTYDQEGSGMCFQACNAFRNKYPNCSCQGYCTPITEGAEPGDGSPGFCE